MRRKAVSVILAGLMAAGMLAGCGGSGSSSASSSASAADSGSAAADSTTVASGSSSEAVASTSGTTSASGDQDFSGVTISMMADTDTLASNNGITAVIDAAEKKFGFTITMESRVGGTEGDNLMKTRLASGDMTDITLYNSGSLLGAVNPAQNFVDITDQDFVSTYDDTYKSTVTVDDKVYGIPLESTQGGAIMYNKAIYKELGLEVPKTWDDFISNCQAIKDAGYTALIGTFGDSWTSQVLFLGDNYNVIAANPDFAEKFEAGEAKFSTVKEATESFSKYGDLLDFYNKDYLSAKYADGCEMLANKQGAQWIMLTQALGAINTDYPDVMDDMGVFAIPGDSADSNGLTVWYPSSWYINKNTKNLDACLALMKFWCSKEGIEIYTQNRMPNGPSCIKGIELGEDVPEAVRVDMQSYFDDGNTLPALEFLTAVKGPNCPNICQEVASGQTTGEEAAAKYDEDCKNQAIQLGLNWS